MAMKTKTIRIQPASISRRKARGISKGGKRIQSGRPSTIEVGNAKGRKGEHNLALNIKKIAQTLNFTDKLDLLCTLMTAVYLSHILQLVKKRVLYVLV